MKAPRKKKNQTITFGQYLLMSENPIVRDALGRYKRGDIDYIQAVERIAVMLLGEL